MMSRISRILLLLVFTTSTLASSIMLPQTASAELENPDTRMARYTEKWLRYRALSYCFYNGISYNDTYSYDEIIDGEAIMGGESTAIGYLNDDGKVSCNDGSFVNNSAKKIGWEDSADMICSMSISRCNGNNYTLNEIDLGKIRTSFEQAKGKLSDSGSFPVDPSGAMWYFLYKRTLETFCGGGTVINKTGTNDNLNSSSVVSAHYVDPQTGEITRINYKLKDKNENDTINDIYSGRGKGGNGDSIDKKCWEIAEKTRQHSGDYSQWVSNRITNSIKESVLSQNEELISSAAAQRCAVYQGRPASQNPDGLSYQQCIQNFRNQVETALNECAQSPSLRNKSIEDKTELLNGCIRDIPGLENATTTPEQIAEDIDQVPPDGSSCAVDGIGWIICPVTKFIAGITDKVFDILEGMFSVPASYFDSSGPTYAIWSQIRNLANVAFIVAFLFVIYSQITGFGISNYGIKKLLPKVIIAAVLVNISFWICAIFVDLSNIGGSAVKSLLDNASGGVTGSSANQLGTWDNVTGWILAGSTTALAGVAVTGLVLGSGGVLAALAALLPLMIAALFAIFTVVIILAARQALIVILIVIAPLAFVAYLLPNTESWFKRWLKTFGVLLLVYPMIALVFGGSKLAAFVVQATAENVFVYIFSLAIVAIPLFVTPLLLKLSGGVLSRFGGIVNNLEKGPFDRAKNWGKGVSERQTAKSQNAAMNSTAKRNPFRRRLQKNARRDAIHENQKSELNRGTTDYIADLAEKDNGFREKLAKSGGEGANMRALANAINVQAELSTKEVRAASAVIEHANLSSDELNTLAKGGNARNLSGRDDAFRKAAIASAISTGTVQDVESIIKSAGSMSDEQRKILSTSVASSGIAGKAAYLGGKTIDDIAQGKVTSEDDLNRAMAETINKGKFTAEALAGSDKDTLKRLFEVSRQGQGGSPGNTVAVSVEQVGALGINAATALNDDRLNVKVQAGAAKATLENMSSDPRHHTP